MPKTTIILTAFALVAAQAVLPGKVMAQNPMPCQGTATDVNGVLQTQGVTPAGGVDGTCEVLMWPDGRLMVQNGTPAGNPDGIDARHEGVGGR